MSKLRVSLEYAWSMARVWLGAAKEQQRSSKEAVKEQQRSSLEVAWSMVKVCLRYAYAIPMRLRLVLNDITARRSRGYGSSLTSLRLTISMLLMLTLGSVSVWGQTPDYSGTYYIKSISTNKQSTGDYYLCPTEGWAFFVSDDTNPGTVQGDDNGKPFLTTYHCKNGTYDATKAVWNIEKGPESEFYYIKQTKTDKYLVSNGAICSNSDRARVHLEKINNPKDLGDKVLFKIYLYNNEYLVIQPKSITTGTHKWLTVNQGNKDNLAGTNAKTDGPSGFPNTGGIICIYTENDANAKWELENALSIDAPIITNNYNGTITITAETGATIFYTTDGTEPTTESYTGKGTTSVNIDQTESMTVIKAIAKATSDPFPTSVTTYYLPVCEKPVITQSGSIITITCTTEDAIIHYTTNGDPATSSSATYTGPFDKGSATEIRAIATKAGYVNSSEAAILPPTEVSSSDEMTDMSGNYILASNFSSNASIGTSDHPFAGTIDGNMMTLSGLNHPFVAYANGAIIKNVILDNVSISGNDNGNAGAICGEATGDTRIYNCGVLATGSTVNADKNGYTYLTDCSSSVSGSNYVGGIVGLLDGSARVINCFSFANVSGGNYAGGIVGYNNVATKSNNLKTMVMNCMFYGEVSGSSQAPIYNGSIITNRGDQSGVSNFNYFWAGASYVQNSEIDVYNCALSAETRFLQRFEFFRHMLNSNRELAAWWATGSMENKEEIMKWVLEPSQIGSSTPYPILKTPGQYPSVVNIDADHAEAFAVDAATKKTQYNQGRKFGTFTISIQNASSGAPNGANINLTSVTPNITDKDPVHFNFNYYKVQLPYYNDVGTKNYTDNKVVTGWKIVAISGGTHSFSTGEDATATADEEGNITLTTPYNFADRKSTGKDKFDVSERVFSQGAYFDVPEGVTSITIEPYWGKCVYVSDAYPDVVYNQVMSTATNVTTVGGGQRYTNGESYDINGNSQAVYTTMSAAVTALNPSGSVYDNAIVLVGNVHSLSLSNETKSKRYTIMSIDLDKDNEPDYSYILRFDSRKRVHPVRIDFLNVIGLGMAQKSNGGTGTYNFGIMQPYGWFECTNTGLFRVTQLEYDLYDSNNGTSAREESPMILQGGVIEQWVTVGGAEDRYQEAKSVTYYHIGGNVWFKEFHIGVHQDKTKNQFVSKHPPISVTGGDYDIFYLTGYYNSPNNNYDDNAECYINGGRFNKVAGTGMQGIGNLDTHANGNITWQIDNADINEFYGGGINAAHIAEGNIMTVISNSRVDQFCGGPKFGDMNSGRKVVTNATNCTFRTFFGAGYGGNSYNRRYPANQNNVQNINWNTWVSGDNGLQYRFNSTYGGVETRIDYQFIPMSSNTSNVARLFVDYVSFSLATTRDVTSKLTDCTITKSALGSLDLFSQCVGNFYGGGNLGMVDGPVKSTLTNCTVEGSVFGAGYSASMPPVAVMDNSFQTEPKYDPNLGAYLEAVMPSTETYTWQHRDVVNSTETAIDKTNHILYTTADLTTLGAVSGKATLTINGTTTVGESVYGGGEESGVGGDTEVNVTGGTIGTAGLGGAEYGNVFGGGKGKNDDVNAGLVKGNASVNISGTAEATKILHNVYGGGAFGSVGTFTAFDAKGFPTALTTATGTANVTITGGTIGSNGHDNGMVFGSSRGSEGDPESDANVDRIAWVGNTNVVIGTSGAETNATPWIKGSVYGGGENGHNFKDASVTIHSGTIGITSGNTITVGGIEYPGARYANRGNVYGGGCGTDTFNKVENEQTNTYFDFNAGIVRGNATVEIYGGHVVHNVYGGGAMGSVGTYTFDANGKPTLCAEGTGTCTVTISGGQIGVAGAKMAGYGKGGPDDFGHVFGAGRGEMHNPDHYPNVETCAYFNETKLIISGTAFLTGSAYGGSESGHVLGDTEVNISGGQIGCGKNTDKPFADAVWANDYVPTGDVTESLDCASWPFTAPFAPYDPFANAEGDLDKYPNGKSTDGGRLEASDGHTYYGNVFGGGSGSVPYFDTTEGISKYLSTAGSVEGKTTINITGGHILTNVYGGCEATNVKGSATITMKGGTVGVPRTVSQIIAHPNTGYVFGAGKGDQRIFFNKETNVDRTSVNIEGGWVYGSVFGGGEDGHVFQNATVNIGKDNDTTEGPTIGTWGTSYVDGNVFGGGRGFGGEALTAGNIGGSVELNIKSGKILGSVYGGGRVASVGYGLYLVDEEITEGGETKKPYGILRPDDQYDGSYTNPSSDPATTYYDKGRGYITINISGGTIGNDFEYIYNPTAEQKAEIPNTTFDYQNHLQYTKGGNVFTGGMGRLYALDGTTLLPQWSKLGKCKQTTLNMTGGWVKSSVYGGGEIGAVAENATVNINGGTVGTKVVDPNDATKSYYFGSVFGGGKGSVDNITYPSTTPAEEQIPIIEAGTTGGNVTVKLNETVASDDDAKGAIVNQVFGCNDMNGSPKGMVTVHVYATQNVDKADISTKAEKGTDTYDVMAVYGGGNLAAYEPTNLTTCKTNVIIDGCGLTSIRQVYGGGNAASTPATDVKVNGTYEILEIFGGGNGLDNLPDGRPNPGANVGYKNYTVYEKDGANWVAKDDPDYDTKEERTADGSTITYGTGRASINVFGGTVHRVFGGSNTKGNVRQTAVTLLDEGGACEFCVDEAYGGGKSAPMDAEAKLQMACIPGLKAAYGGAEAAAIKGNVTLNITNGTFDRVFGGNNISGTIDGSITVNIEEVGCRPVIIGELYGGGNLAGYSVYGYNADGTPKETGTKLYEDPQVNVKSFTSIGKIYGGGFGVGATMVGNPTVNVNEVYGRYYDDDRSVVNEGAETPNHYPIPSHAKGKMGAIHTVFGGGNAAKVMGNTTVNIATQAEVYIVKEVTADAALPEGCYTRSGAGTTDDPFVYTAATGTASADVTYYEKKPVLGADIRENVYGGGNNAEVTGDAKVQIGKKKVE